MDNDSVPQFVLTLPSHLGRNKRLLRSNLTRGVPQSAQRSIEESNWSVDEMKSGRGHDRTPSPAKRVRCYRHLRESQRGCCYHTNGQILQCQESTSDKTTRLVRGVVTAEGGQSLSGGSIGNRAGVHSTAVNPEFKADPGSTVSDTRRRHESSSLFPSLGGTSL